MYSVTSTGCSDAMGNLASVTAAWSIDTATVKPRTGTQVNVGFFLVFFLGALLVFAALVSRAGEEDGGC